jgi:GntR family transcriptional regulator/MocR family aminotransferase
MLRVAVDRSQGATLMRQVYDQIRLSIVRGNLRAGEQLPSTRQLAAELRVSRIVILEVYDQLLAEGYIESRQGSGTYVAERAYLEAVRRDQFPLVRTPAGARKENKSIIDFRSGLPALDLFPRKLWGQLGSRVCAESSPAIFGYDHPEGCAELRIALARYLAKTRGVQCHPDQLVITSGAAQAFSLVARLLLSPGDEVIIEDPVTYEVQLIFSAAGAALYPIPVDEYGMQTDLLPREKRPGFVFVTPSHQFPLGGILAIQRRIQLIQFARMVGCYIVEDDYDSEFRYSGTPVSSLQELEPDRVIYVGTLSKSLSPALRLGYAILPPLLVEQCRRLKHLTDLHSPVLEQLVLARFLEEGHLERHIMKMKKIYRKRREVLIAALMRHFSRYLSISGDATGLHLIAEFHGRAFTEQTIADLEDAGVRLYPVERHAIRKGYHQSKVILGYGNLTQGEIEEGVRRIKTVLDQGGRGI